MTNSTPPVLRSADFGSNSSGFAQANHFIIEGVKPVLTLCGRRPLGVNWQGAAYDRARLEAGLPGWIQDWCRTCVKRAHRELGVLLPAKLT